MRRAASSNRVGVITRGFNWFRATPRGLLSEAEGRPPAVLKPPTSALYRTAQEEDKTYTTFAKDHDGKMGAAAGIEWALVLC